MKLRATFMHAVALAAAALALGCHGQPSMMSPAGPGASRIEWLYWLIFWITFAAFVLMMYFLTHGAGRSRAESAEMLPIMSDDEGDHRANYFVGGALGVTVLSLFLVLIFSMVTIRKAHGLTSKNPVTIQITGHQWWWEVTYPNSQADQTVTTANEIHVPVGTPIVVLTASSDVIHSFWAPNIQGKRDLIPGYQTALWFEVDAPGIYRGQCAEYCGHQHAHMAFEIVAEPADKFQAWLAQQVKPAAPPPDPQTFHGEQVFLTHQCVMCHTIRGTSAGSRVGPDLTHVASRRRIAAGTLANTRGALSGWIVDPQRIKPGAKMPANPLQPDDLTDLVAYLQSLD